MPHRPAPPTAHSNNGRVSLLHQRHPPLALHTPHFIHRTVHTQHRNALSSFFSSSLPTATARRSSLRSSTSLSSLPSSTSLQPFRPFTQYVVISLLVLSGYFLRKKYLEMRAMRPDLQSSPLDPTRPGVQYHEGGFGEKMDRTEAALILGVRDNASKEKIMERYRQLMKVNHPDLGGSPYVSTKINEAKELLSKTARSEHEGERRGGKRWQKI